MIQRLSNFTIFKYDLQNHFFISTNLNRMFNKAFLNKICSLSTDVIGVVVVVVVVLKLFTCLTFSQKPLGQFQPNLHNISLGVWYTIFCIIENWLVFFLSKSSFQKSVSCKAETSFVVKIKVCVNHEPLDRAMMGVF